MGATTLLLLSYRPHRSCCGETGTRLTTATVLNHVGWSLLLAPSSSLTEPFSLLKPLALLRSYVNMTLDASTVQELIKKLAEDRATYLDTITHTHDLLAKAIESQAHEKPQVPLTTERLRRNTGTTLATTNTDDIVTVPKDANFSVDEDSDTDDDESLFVQQTLQPEIFEEDELRKHIREYPWTPAGKSILRDILDNDEILTRRHLFPTQLGPVNDRSHLSHYSIFDGVPILYEYESVADSRCSRQ